MDSKTLHIENTNQHVPATSTVQKKEKSKSIALEDNRPKSVLQKKHVENSINESVNTTIQKKVNSTGLPDNLKSGIENLSGHSMDDVKVHYNSAQPAQLNAHAYTQGTDIHIASGQEKHLPHEAWHVIQQKQGRVKPTLQMKGKMNVNDDKGLENEADVMGAKAVQMQTIQQPVFGGTKNDELKAPLQNSSASIQRVSKIETSIKPNTKRVSEVVQRISINKKTVSDAVWQVYRELGQEAKTLLRFSQTFHVFFILSPQEQIDFLHALNHSTFVVNTLIQSNSRAITNSEKPSSQFPLLQLQLQFLRINPNFMDNLLAVTQGHTGTFHFSKTNSISIASFPPISSLGPRKALLGPDEQKLTNRLVKQSQISIHSVMNVKNLSQFMVAQHLFQQALRSMDDLKSVGYEFEFASFALPDGIYSEKEIIPSHQLMAKSAIGGNFFGLSWRLESDSKNTLELVSPPFVFSRDELGQTKSNIVKRDLETEADGLATKIDQKKNGTLQNTAAFLSKLGIGFGWNVESKYKNYRILKNKKSEGKVYSQQNVSLHPHEIGKLLDDKFVELEISPTSKSSIAAIYPTNVARLVREHFLAELPKGIKHPDPVKQAISIFARYASNVLAIPSFRHRQVTGERKDTMATEIKETLGVWVKTDPLNILKHLLKDPADLGTFHTALGNARLNILTVFDNASGKFVRDAVRPDPPAPSVPEIKARMDILRPQMQNLTALQLMNFAKNELITERAHQGPDPSVAVEGYTIEMLQDVTAFIQRALQVHKHEESNPKSTTSEFLAETFGTGEGVRKGTYIKGVPTSKGPMYVTELR